MDVAVRALFMIIRHGCKMVMHYAELYFGVAGAWVAAFLLLAGFFGLMYLL